MKHVFIDTSALIALKDSSDVRHDEALRYFESALSGPSMKFVLTNYLLCEVHAYFCRAPSVALKYVEHLLDNPHFQIARAEERDESRALALLRSSRDKTYSFADAVSFAVMERLDLDSAFTFDRHFKQHGRCRVLPD